MDVCRYTKALIVVLAAACSVPRLAMAGDVSWEGGITAVYQHADDNRVDDEITASADLFITLPRDNGEWLVYVEASSTPDGNGISARYPTANADAGSVIDNDGDGGVQISEFNYTFRLAGRSRLMLGLIDPSAWLDRGRIANDENLHFLNGSFVNNATIEFPDYTLGAVYRRHTHDVSPEFVLILASSDGLADLPDRSYQELLDLNADERGLFLGTGISWLRQHTSARLGAWLRSDEHNDVGSPEDTQVNYGVYAVLGWQADGHGLNARFGIANKDVSVATRFVSVAYERETRFGVFGAGIARTWLSDDFRQANLDDVTGTEIFYRIPLAGDAVHLTPSIQHVENPGFDASGATLDSQALVFGIRLRWIL